jgi:hypothetical protein
MRPSRSLADTMYSKTRSWKATPTQRAFVPHGYTGTLRSTGAPLLTTLRCATFWAPDPVPCALACRRRSPRRGVLPDQAAPGYTSVGFADPG